MIMKRLVKLTYVKSCKKWHIEDPLDDDSFLMYIYDCHNFRRLTENASKIDGELYMLEFKRYNEIEDKTDKGA